MTKINPSIKTQSVLVSVVWGPLGAPLQVPGDSCVFGRFSLRSVLILAQGQRSTMTFMMISLRAVRWKVYKLIRRERWGEHNIQSWKNQNKEIVSLSPSSFSNVVQSAASVITSLILSDLPAVIWYLGYFSPEGNRIHQQSHQTEKVEVEGAKDFYKNAKVFDSFQVFMEKDKTVHNRKWSDSEIQTSIKHLMERLVI